jgi:hypothetical protein
MIPLTSIALAALLALAAGSAAAATAIEYALVAAHAGP